MSDAGHETLPIRIVRKFLYSNLSMPLIILAMALGIAALVLTPREEEPQIVVPLADVIVTVPGRSAAEIEQLISTRLEKLLYQIDGVEYVYSMIRENQCIVTVRFYVGQDREKSLVKLYNKVQQNIDQVPIGVSGWIVKPVEIDDVPVLTLSLTSAKSDDAMLRRVGQELADRLQGVENTSITAVTGGRARELRVDFMPEMLTGHSVSVNQVADALETANTSMPAGSFTRENRKTLVTAGMLFKSAKELEGVVVEVSDGKPVYLRDVAKVSEGIGDVTSYVRFSTGPAWDRGQHGEAAGASLGPAELSFPASQQAVVISVAKKKGTNAVWVAEAVLKKVEELKKEIIPSDMALVVTRNMGVTADHKVNELLEALGVAILIVVALLTLAMGWRSAFVVAAAVPIVFALTLAVNLLFGYTINRVTLFALILALGLLVDDPIVDVENIHRHFTWRKKASRGIVLEAVNEVRPPLISATIAVILSFVPMFFITGMMGPYMRPMALNVPVTMIMSMVVSFTITPWLSYHLLRKMKHSEGEHQESTEEELHKSLTWRIFKPMMEPLLKKRWITWSFMGVVLALLGLTAAMPMFRSVPLKMLPFDNKNELQVVVDLPEGSSLESTAALLRDLEDQLRTTPEVAALESYAGVASPMDFNGLVRHYYFRKNCNQGEIRVIMADKKIRKEQSHTIALRIRDDLTAIAKRHNARLKLVESPPGPPVVSTVVAEVYGGPEATHEQLRQGAKVVAERLKREPGIVDVDTTTEEVVSKRIFKIDHVKAAVFNVKETEIEQTMLTALGGRSITAAEAPGERESLPIVLRMPEGERSSEADLSRLYVHGENGVLTPIAELGSWVDSTMDQTIYHKNLRPVQYVFAEAAGRTPAETILDVNADLNKQIGRSVEVKSRTFFNNGGGIPWKLPYGDLNVTFSGEGEWNITLDVFRDLGIAFGAAMLAIYILLIHETGSFLLPLVIMLAIPMTIMGVMPGFYLLNVFAGGHSGGYADPVLFTATAMIGMIALSGIVTRDAIILVDFIHHSLKKGKNLFDAIMESRVVRLRPIVLTSLSAMLGALPITLDPIFSGLAWSLIFGLFASTILTLFVIPVAYWVIYEKKPGHGLPMADEE